jgi:hypothetical protein
MSIKIYFEKNFENIAFLCENDWDLPSQISELQDWLNNNPELYPDTKKIIDIGFSIRPDASGGGSVLTSALMTTLVNRNYELFLSEYPI